MCLAAENEVSVIFIKKIYSFLGGSLLDEYCSSVFQYCENCMFSLRKTGENKTAKRYWEKCI